MSQNNEIKTVSEVANGAPKSLFIPKGNPLIVKCPICGCNESEINSLEHGEERDFEADGYQQAYAYIEFFGKCSHLWTLTFISDSEGKMYINVTYLLDGCRHFVFPISGSNENKSDDETHKELGALFG